MFRSTVIKGTEALSWASWPAVGLRGIDAESAKSGILSSWIVTNLPAFSLHLHVAASYCPAFCDGRLWRKVGKSLCFTPDPHWKHLLLPPKEKLFRKWMIYDDFQGRKWRFSRAKISAHTTCISHIKCKTGPIEPFKNRYTMHPGVHFSPKCFEKLNVCMKKMGIQPNRTAPNQNQRQKPKVCTQKHPEVLRVVQLLLPFNFLMLGATWNSVTKQTSWIYLTLQSNILFQHMPTCSHLCTMSIGTP